MNGDVFIDASYEGDLMKLAGVPFQIGREPGVHRRKAERASLPTRKTTPECNNDSCRWASTSIRIACPAMWQAA